MIEFHLPTLPPSKNALRQRTKTGIARTDDYKSWIKNAGKEMQVQRVRGVKGPYKLTIQAVRPNRKRRDLGNLLEATEDLLTTMHVIEDDSLSEMIVMRWLTVGSGVTIRVEAAGVEA
jgi:Holliday junction resolvase RusA-like endonuclease